MKGFIAEISIYDRGLMKHEVLLINYGLNVQFAHCNPVQHFIRWIDFKINYNHMNYYKDWK